MLKKRLFTGLLALCIAASLTPAALAAPAAKTVKLDPYTTKDDVLMNSTVTIPKYYGEIDLPLEMYDDAADEWIVRTVTCDVVGLDAAGHAFSVQVDSAVQGKWTKAEEVTYFPPQTDESTSFTAEYGLYEKWSAAGSTVSCGSYTGVNDYFVFYDYGGQEQYFVHSEPMLVLTDEMIAYFLKNGTLSSNNRYTYPGLRALLTESDSGTAYASKSTVYVDGKSVTFDMYALKDASGNSTNYVKLRDIAHILNGTAAQFNVGWNGAITLTTDVPYASGSEMSTPFSGNQPYKSAEADIYINGKLSDLEAITLTDAKGGSYNYFKLRDLGKALGFNVSWSEKDGAILISSGEPYSG